MKWYENMLIVVAGIPLLIGGLIAFAALLLGTSAVVLFRRMRNALIV